MGVNLSDLGVENTQKTLSVTDRILENSRRKGMSFFDVYWPSAGTFDSNHDANMVFVDSRSSDDISDREGFGFTMGKRKCVVSKKLSIPRENEGLIGSSFGSGGRRRSYDSMIGPSSGKSSEFTL